jgi:hypothetical protein
MICLIVDMGLASQPLHNRKLNASVQSSIKIQSNELSCTESLGYGIVMRTSFP